MNNTQALVSWSGGKDSCFALMQMMTSDIKPVVLLNVLNEEGKISRSHGIPLSILQAQSQALQLPLHCVASSWKDYEKNFIEALSLLKRDFGLSNAVFGDIDLQEHRDWEEKVCKQAGLTAQLPLWKKDRKQLVLAMINAGIHAVIVSCNEVMGKDFLGRKVDRGLIDDLEKIGVDPCGENGEYHTLVTDAPVFRNEVDVVITDKVLHENYWFAQLALQ